MIFKSVSDWENKTEKSFFIEQISVYIRLVQVFCEKENIPFECDDVDVVDELKSIGVIDNADELPTLKKEVPALYDDFIIAVRIAVKYGEQMDGLLDKLYNSKRKQIQSAAKKKKNLTLVDFF